MSAFCYVTPSLHTYTHFLPLYTRYNLKRLLWTKKKTHHWCILRLLWSPYKYLYFKITLVSPSSSPQLTYFLVAACWLTRPLNVNRLFHLGSYRKTAGSLLLLQRVAGFHNDWDFIQLLKTGNLLITPGGAKMKHSKTQVHINTRRAIKHNVVACSTPCIAPGRGGNRPSSVAAHFTG